MKNTENKIWNSVNGRGRKSITAKQCCITPGTDLFVHRAKMPTCFAKSIISTSGNAMNTVAATDADTGETIFVPLRAVAHTSIPELFADEEFVSYMQEHLPKYMRNANNLSLHNGKLGPESGKMRERSLIYLLQRYVGEDAYDAPVDDFKIGVMEKSLDVMMFDRRVSIKTVTWTGTKVPGVKINWVDDKQKALEEARHYVPDCDLLFLPITWGRSDYLYYLPQSLQHETMESVGRDRYFDIGKGYSKGTKIKCDVMHEMMRHQDTLKLPISWPTEYRDDNIIYQVLDAWYGEGVMEDEENEAL